VISVVTRVPIKTWIQVMTLNIHQFGILIMLTLYNIKLNKKRNFKLMTIKIASWMIVHSLSKILYSSQLKEIKLIWNKTIWHSSYHKGFKMYKIKRTYQCSITNLTLYLLICNRLMMLKETLISNIMINTCTQYNNNSSINN
jgi:hypothetical protein